MSWDMLKGDWKQLKGKVKETWGQLTDDDLDRIDGRRDQLVGNIQARYGRAKQDVEREVDEFTTRYLDRKNEERRHELGDSYETSPRDVR